jgi:predicted flap endonuclease-1-like 5' DNA nuclease
MTQEQLSLAVTVVLLLLGLVAALYALSRVRERRAEVEAASPPAAAVPAAAKPAEAPPAAQAAASVSAASSPFLAAPQGEPDDLGRIKGIGPKLSARLAELGVFHYAQIADWTPAQLAAVDAELGNFSGRPERDQWQAQARLLASGDLKAYERAHGKLAEPPAGA